MFNPNVQFIEWCNEKESLSRLGILFIEREMLEEFEYKNLISNFKSKNSKKIKLEVTKIFK